MTFLATRTFLAGIPWQVYGIAALVAAIPINGCVQYREGARDKEAELRAEYKAKLAEATKAAEAAKKSEEEALVALAKETDNAVEQGLRDELARARDFIARNRVRPSGRGEACGPAAPARNNRPGNDAGAGQAPVMDEGGPVHPDSADGYVVVPAGDVLICTENTVKAEEWREWGLALQRRGK